MRAIPFILVLAGCGPSVSYAPFRAAPNRIVPTASVEVFFAPPRCPFEELGSYNTIVDALEQTEAADIRLVQRIVVRIVARHNSANDLAVFSGQK